MTVNYRALLTWFLLLAFLILLVLRLDEKVQWNWFIIFIPLWVLDVAIVIYIVFFTIKHFTSGVNNTCDAVMRKFWFLGCVMLKILFEILICLRLEYLRTMGSYYVMMPAWLLLVLILLDLSRNILKRVGVPVDSISLSSCCKKDWSTRIKVV